MDIHIYASCIYSNIQFISCVEKINSFVKYIPSSDRTHQKSCCICSNRNSGRGVPLLPWLNKREMLPVSCLLPACCLSDAERNILMRAGELYWCCSVAAVAWLQSEQKYACTTHKNCQYRVAHTWVAYKINGRYVFLYAASTSTTL